MFKIILFFSVCSLTLALRCYDCDPSSKNQCRTPEQDQIKETECTVDSIQTKRFFKLIGNSNTDFECFSIYYKDDNKQNYTGVYRGCTYKITSNQCGISLPDGFNGNITQCLKCEENVCNKLYVNDGSSVSIPMVLITLSTLLGLLISKF